MGGQFLIIGNGQVRYQGRLGQLYPLHAGLIQLGQYLLVCLDGVIQAVERRLGRTLCLLRQGQQGDWADEVRAHGVACRAGLFYQLGNALRVRLEVLVIGDFRDDVVVIGIKPLGHLQRRGVLIAARQGELIIQGLAGHGANGQCGLEHLVVVGDVGRNGVVLSKSQIAQAVISIQAEGMCGGLEGFRIDAAGPVGFQRAL